MKAIRLVASPRRSRWRLLGVTLVAVICMAACARTKDAASTSQEKSAPTHDANTVVFSAAQVQHGGVRWAVPEARSASSVLELPAQILPNEDRTERLGAPVQARVVTVHVQFGDMVRRGDPLVTLQSREASAARADLDKASAELNSRRAAANYARGAKERAERLLAAKAMGRQEVERAAADDEIAQAALAQAEAEVERSRATAGQLGLAGSDGAIVLRATRQGTVLSRDALPGAMAEPGTPLVSVTDTSTLWLDVSSADPRAVALEKGAHVRFRVPAFPDETFESDVQSVGGALDPATRTVTIRALVKNAGGRLRPGMFATAWIELGASREALLVPEEAVQLLDEKPVVFVAHPDDNGGAAFQRRDVEVSKGAGPGSHILSGLKPGETVVVAGAFAVKAEFARSKMAKE